MGGYVEKWCGIAVEDGGFFRILPRSGESDQKPTSHAHPFHNPETGGIRSVGLDLEGSGSLFPQIHTPYYCYELYYSVHHRVVTCEHLARTVRRGP